jgi:hypothetical protein
MYISREYIFTTTASTSDHLGIIWEWTQQVCLLFLFLLENRESKVEGEGERRWEEKGEER